jgi:GT2 family glycosyltransferase
VDRELDCESINGSCFVARLDFLDAIGYLDEGTFLYLEELILGRQIRDRNHTACLVTSVRVLHNQGATTGHGGRRVRLSALRWTIASEVHYSRKYLSAPWPALGVLLGIRSHRTSRASRCSVWLVPSK